MKRLFLVISFLVLQFMVSSALGAPFNYSDFSSIAGIDLVGDAIHTGNRIRLTPAVYDQAGAAWYTSKQYIEQGFETVFQFQTSDLGGVGPGADGFGFLIQNTSTSALGLYAGGIGYAEITNSIAIEFDTYHNLSIGDPDDNHISVQTRGTAENSVDHAFSLGCTSAIPNMSDENIHTAKVKYTPETLSVFLDDLTNPCLTISSADVLGLLQLDEGQAWVGFTAATGGGYENHDILSWEFSEIPEPATVALLGLGSLSLLRRRRNNQLSADRKKQAILALVAVLVVCVFGLPEAFAVVYYQDGGTHTISAIIDDFVQVRDSATGQSTTVEIISGGWITEDTTVYDTSELTVTDGVIADTLDGWDHSQITVTGGSIWQHLTVGDNSQVTISGGSIGWSLSALDNSQITVSGGSIGEHIYLGDYVGPSNSLITFVGSDFAINEESVGYGQYYASDYAGGQLTGTLANGDVLDNWFMIYHSSCLQLVPEPATVALLGLGALSLIRRRKK